MNCSKCGDELKFGSYKLDEVEGPVCLKCFDAIGKPIKTTKVFFMSSPKTTAADRRSYLIRVPGEPAYLVRIFPADGNPDLKCDCPATELRCDHVGIVEKVDRNKFTEKEN